MKKYDRSLQNDEIPPRGVIYSKRKEIMKEVKFTLAEKNKLAQLKGFVEIAQGNYQGFVEFLFEQYGLDKSKTYEFNKDMSGMLEKEEPTADKK